MIVGTGNHWVIDALVGWIVILVAWVIAEAIGRIPVHRLVHRLIPRRTLDERPSREDAAVVD